MTEKALRYCHDEKKRETLRVLAAEQQPDVCQPWSGRIGTDGYGYIWLESRNQTAHHAMWTTARGPLAAGFVVDHARINIDPASCSRACVNLYHLEAIYTGENIRRGHGPSARNMRKTHCDYGHAFSARNTYWWRGKRNCRECYRRRDEQLRRKAGCSIGRGSRNAAKTRCARGHLYTFENTYFHKDGARVCRACNRERASRRRLEREHGV